MGKNLINCKNYRQVGTFNARTLRVKKKRDELAYLFKKYNLDILCIVDHKIIHEDQKIRIEALEGCKLITTSAWTNSKGAAQGGVGILVGKDAEKSLAEINPINERILEFNFNGNPGTTVVVNYAPVEGSDNAENHFEMLSDVINKIPKHRVILECGDFNAHLGKEDFPFSYHEETNTNREFLIEHALEGDLRITNTLFEKKKGKSGPLFRT